MLRLHSEPVPAPPCLGEALRRGTLTIPLTEPIDSLNPDMNTQYSEGTVPVPRTALALCDCAVVPFQELSLRAGCHSGGGGGIHPWPP